MTDRPGSDSDEDDEPIYRFEMDIMLRQAWWGVWFFLAFGALVWLAAGFTVSPFFLLGLLPAVFTGWANLNLRNVTTDGGELKWLLLAVLGLVVLFGAIFVVHNLHFV